MTHAGPRFTSSKCPAGPGLENTCELPFGLVWTPLLSEDDSTAMPAAAVTEEPILCLTCLAYFNLYAQIRQQENQWICPWCGAENVLPQKNAESLLQPYMSQSVLEIQQPLKEPFKKDVTNWILCLDEHLPCLEVQAIGQTVSNLLLESESTIHLGLLIFGKHVTIYHVGSAKSKLVSAQVVASHTDFVTGNEDDEDEPSEVDPQYYQTMSTAQDVQHLWHCLAAHYQITIPDETTKEQQTPNTPKSRLEILKLRKQKRLAAAKNEGKSGASSSGWTLAKPNPIMRATGHALQCAVELAARPVQPAARTARILLVTNGCPNYGPASVVDDDSSSSKNNQHVDPYKLAIAQEYLDTLGQTAVAAGIGIDVLCTGSLELAMPAYQSLVQASSGYALAQDSVQELKRNLQFLWKETALSGQYTESAHPQDWVDGCLVDLRMSSFIEATHVVGMGEFVSNEDRTNLLPPERSAFHDGSQRSAAQGFVTRDLPHAEEIQQTLTRIRFGRIDPLSTLSVLLARTHTDDAPDHALFQCIVRYTTATMCVTRIATHRLAVASHVTAFLDGIDEPVVAVVLAKEAVYRAFYGRNEEGQDKVEDESDYQAQQDLDVTVRNISGAFRLLGLQEGARGMDLTEEGQTKAAGTSLDFTFPPELSDAVRRLYHLRRGPLISPGPLQSVDDREEKRSLFLRLPLDACICMMAPSLWKVEGGSMESVPPETLVLWENATIAADHYMNLFVWSGRAAENDNDSRDYLRQWLEERTKDRFPAPQLHMLTESDSMSRRFTSLLAPSHADPVDHQIAHFPQLSRLSADELTQLRAKFRFHDPEADPSFRQWFWDVSSASSTGGSGVSLCE